MKCRECEETTDEPEKLHWKIDDDGCICPACSRSRFEEVPDDWAEALGCLPSTPLDD